MKRLLLTLLPGMLLGIFIGCSGESDTGPAAGSADDPTMGSMGTTPGADEEGSEEAATDNRRSSNRRSSNRGSSN